MDLHIHPSETAEEPARLATAGGAFDPAEMRAMRRALRLARRGLGGTHPNPLVGAVVLSVGTPVGEGFHARAGLAHAEVRALEAAGERARGGTLVVTLEPCAHIGRTPPCTDAILAAGIRRVVIGMLDPNPLVDGRGIERLEAAGVEVARGLLEDGCRELNAAYLKHLATGLPWVTLKAMVSLDGRMASDSGGSKGLGGDAELRLAHRLRAACDAVIAGVGTILADDPLLTVRLAPGRTPARVVLDSTLRTPPDARIWSTASEAPLIFATLTRDGERVRAAKARGAEVWTFPPGPDRRVPLRSLLRRLDATGRLAVLVEGGAAVHTAFLREGLADRVAIGVAPLILGGAHAPAFAGDLGRSHVIDAIPVERLRARRVGRDVWIEGAIGGRGAEHV